MGLQHDNPNLPSQPPPRMQRLTADEARAVIDFWQQERAEQTGLTDNPAVPDVAEGLDIPVEEVQRLLGEVRAQRLEEERALAQEQELSEIRLAEEERRLAEIRRQRAELRREQAEIERENTPVSVLARTPQASTPLARVVVLVALVFWFLLMFNLIHSSRHRGQNSSPPVADCQITSPDGKSEPCPAYVREQILHADDTRTHR